MIITDLSYLNEVSEETVFGATGIPSSTIDFSKRISALITINVNANVNVRGAVNEVAFKLAAAGSRGAGTEVQTLQTAVAEHGFYLATNEGSVNSFAN